MFAFSFFIFVVDCQTCDSCLQCMQNTCSVPLACYTTILSHLTFQVYFVIFASFDFLKLNVVCVTRHYKEVYVFVACQCVRRHRDDCAYGVHCSKKLGNPRVLTERDHSFLFYFYSIHLQLDLCKSTETDVMNSNGIVRVSFFSFVRFFVPSVDFLER